MNRKRVAMITCIAACLAVAGAGAAEHTKDTPAAVRKAVAMGKAVLLDVREQDEWDEGHLRDAKLLPLSRLQAGVTAAEFKKRIPAGSIVYTHCRSGKRSLEAADLLKKQGYEVRPLKPGYADLLKAGFPKAGAK